MPTSDCFVLTEPGLDLAGQDVSSQVRSLEGNENYLMQDNRGGGDEATSERPTKQDSTVTVNCKAAFGANSVEEELMEAMGSKAGTLTCAWRPKPGSVSASNVQRSATMLVTNVSMTFEEQVLLMISATLVQADASGVVVATS